MIENKELGLLIAENDEEKAWYNTAEGIKHAIHVLELRNQKSEKDLKLSASEIEQKFKVGAKESIKANKVEINVQKEFLKLAESKLKI